MSAENAAHAYELRVTGCVPEAVAGAFPELKAVAIGDQTVFYGDVIDEAHLFGLLTPFRGARSAERGDASEPLSFQSQWRRMTRGARRVSQAQARPMAAPAATSLG
jgi:hypothetical protein